jgi:hypothetical protein
MAMNKKLITRIVMANLAVLLLLAIFAPQWMISPGKPIAAHGELANDCFACHVPFIGSTSRQCIACHQVAEIGLKTTRGIAIDKEQKNVAFHQELVEDDCMACHSEHKGVQPFRPIGRFSHELLRASVQERCDSCHSNPEDALHRKIKGGCAQCHTNDAWRPATFDHREYFRFDRHHDTECATCHVSDDYAKYTCYGCHEHSRSKIREEHFEEGIRDYENCTECHRSGDEDEAKRIWRSGGYRNGLLHRPENAGWQPWQNRSREHDD